MTKKIIGIMGPTASGKDVAADYIAKKLNWPCQQISAPLLEILKGLDHRPTREETANLSAKLTAEYGDGYLAKLALDNIETTGVISGLRQLGQIDYLKKNSKLTLITIDADPQIRFERASSRNKLAEGKTLDEFVATEIKENSPPFILRLFECMKLADYRVVNNTSPEAMFAELDKIVDKINNGQ